MQLYIPAGHYSDLVLRECHDARYASHLGVRKTVDLIQRDYYWPTILQDVTAYVQTCEECHKTNLEIKVKHRWERVSMDFITYLPKTR